MKKGIKFIAVITVLLILFTTLPIDAAFLSGKTSMTYLISGADDAAENTDVLCLVNYNKNSGAFTVFQIPRDTYIDGGRVNSIYPTLRARGYSESAAMKELCNVVSSVFSVDIDGYIGVTTEVFVNFIDLIGGIYVTLDDEVALKDGDGKVVLSLNKGENLVGAEDALRFLRYRTGYIRGDLQRMEMQRIFMRGLYDTALNRISYRSLVRVAVNSKGIITNISPVALASIVSKRKNHTNPGVSAKTLPGEAICADNGAWYYVINREECIQMLSSIFNVKGEKFDPDKRLCGENEKFKKIYYG